MSQGSFRHSINSINDSQNQLELQDKLIPESLP